MGTVTTVPQLKSMLANENVKSRFKEILGKKAPGFISSIVAVANSNTLLQKAEPQSIMNAAVIAATLDLPINPNLGFAYIIPYGNQASFQIGYKGMTQLAMRSGQYKTINVTEVYEGEIKSENPEMRKPASQENIRLGKGNRIRLSVTWRTSPSQTALKSTCT